MTRLAKTLGLVVALCAFASPVVAQADDFEEGMNLWRRGMKVEALAKFQAVLAADPSHEDAYEMWKAADQEILLEMLVEAGEYELVAKRLMERARVGRTQRANDDDAIKALLDDLRTNDNALERRRTLRALAADHGEYAVPRMLRALADESNDDWRVVAMHALTQMDVDVVLPLIEAMGTENAFLRRNVALTLGYIGDPRAGAVLAWHASADDDGSVAKAAAEGAARCAGTGEPSALFLRQGDEYHHRRQNVLRPYDYSDVVWSWQGDGLVANEVPRAIYNNELSKKAYYRALAINPSSLDALAGIARASVDIAAKLDALAATGEGVGDLVAKAAEGLLAVESAGADALDLALQWSVMTDDSASGVRLCKALADVATTPTPGLFAALDSPDGGMSGESAVALGRIAYLGGRAASPEVVSVLGASAGNEVMRMAAIIDGDAGRAGALIGALGSEGVFVNHRGSGASGLSMLLRIPGIDVILLGDGLPDMTIDSVIAAIGRNPITAATPVYLVSADEDLASLYEDRVAGTIAGADGIDALESVFDQGLTGDRAQADDLAARSSAVLAVLGRAGHTNISGVLGELASTLAHREDTVTVPAMGALAAAGNADQAGALVGIVQDDGRSEEARIAAAHALAGIFGRHSVSGDVSAGLRDVMTSGASLEVRGAVARALGRVQLTAEERAGLVNDVRVDVNE